MTDNTIKFTVPGDDKQNMRQVLRNVFDALNEKGYNPIIRSLATCFRRIPLISPTTTMHVQ